MARNESDREDLMSEAVSLVKRIECQYPSRSGVSVAGMNTQDWLFVYLDNDPMYRFDEQGRLRRAFVGGKLFRTEGRTLAMLDRHRSLATDDPSVTPESNLLRRDLSPTELQAFRDRMFNEIDELINGLRVGRITRQHPADDVDLVAQIKKRLVEVMESAEFLAPAIVRR